MKIIYLAIRNLQIPIMKEKQLASLLLFILFTLLYLPICSIFSSLCHCQHLNCFVADTIEANVETAYDHVDAGNQELVKASRYQVIPLVFTLSIIYII